MPLIFIIIPIWTYYMWGMIWVVWWIIIDLLLLPLSISIVSPSTVKVVESFNKFNRIIRKGFHFLIPFVDRTQLQILYKRNLLVDVRWTTKNKLNVNALLNIIFYVFDDFDNTEEWSIYKSVYSINEPTCMIKTLINDEFRYIVEKYVYKYINDNKEEISEKVKEKVNKQLEEIGFKLDSIQIEELKTI